MATAYANWLPSDPVSRYIRVFDLQPSRFGTTIRGHLRVVSLENNPSYDALSYAWDNPLPPHHITCADGELPVTTNCYEALHQIRRSFRTSTIWIDSICINQSDEEEKAHQVSLMRDIYRKAKKVYIWLGKGNQHSDYAIDWLLDATLERYPIYAVRIRPFPLMLMPRELIKILRLLLEGAIALYHLRRRKHKLPHRSDAMDDLISRDWFKRMWTIQELVMARDPVVLYGSKAIKWDNLHRGIVSAKDLPDNRNSSDFSNVLDSIVAAYSLWLDLYVITEMSEAPVRKWILGESGMGPTNNRNHILDFMDCYGKTVAAGCFSLFVLAISVRVQCGLAPFKSWWLLLPLLSSMVALLITPSPTQSDWEFRHLRKNLVWILNMTRVRQATIQADRVFALHGLFQELGIPLENPDYRKPVGGVYLEFTRTVIERHKSLEILVEASASQLLDSPSWVPDWSRPYHRIFRRDSVAANNSSKFSFSECGRKLTATGIVVDTVAFCTEMLQELRNTSFSPGSSSLSTTFLFPSMHNVRVLVRWISYTRQLSPDSAGGPGSEALFETVHSDTDFRAMDRGSIRKIFDEWCSVLTADYSGYSMLCPSELACALAISMSESLNRYHRERCQAIAGKSIFFTTSNGHIGRGPPSMLASDCVSLFSGVSVPLVVRVVGSHYQIVGSAYVHGMMQGEAWPQSKAELQQLTLI